MKRKSPQSAAVRRKRLFFLYVAALAVWSVSVAFMPLANGMKDTTPIPMYIDGAVFWLGSIGTVVTVVIISRKRKRSPVFRRLKSAGGKNNGSVVLFRNRTAFLYAVTMLVCVIGFVIAELICSSLYPMFIFLALFIFSSGMFCMLNGPGYKYINHKVRRDVES